MLQRGRKSPASLSFVQGDLPNDRPDPPKELSLVEQDEWRRIVNRMPANWFTPETWSLLGAYCSHVATARALETRLRAPGLSLKELNQLSSMHVRETRAMVSLATKMRLTHQSRFDRQMAGVASRNAAQALKPWDIV